LKLLKEIPQDDELHVSQGTIITYGWYERGNPEFNRCIAFPSVNPVWFRNHQKSSDFNVLYFPLLRKLKVPATLTRQELIRRYAIFGGTVRFVLTWTEEFHEKGVRNLEGAFRSVFSSFQRLQEAFRVLNPSSGDVDMKDLCDYLFHFVPHGFSSEYSLVLGSAEISKRFDKLLGTLRQDEKRQLVK
jgi:hypothetical protein